MLNVNWELLKDPKVLNSFTKLAEIGSENGKQTWCKNGTCEVSLAECYKCHIMYFMEEHDNEAIEYRKECDAAEAAGEKITYPESY